MSATSSAEAGISGAIAIRPSPPEIAITFFSDAFARLKREERLTADQLKQRIALVSQPEKARLPWLKCARFGDRRSDKDSLRHDGNVDAITGIEGDYDATPNNGRLISFEEALARIRNAGINAIVYTSPSFTEDLQKYRVLCPMSAEHPPEDRDRYMARLNGLFDGEFAAESWVLSQSYYYGAVNHNPSHRIEVIDGICIDRADHLDATAIGRPEKPKSAGTNGQRHPAAKPEDITDKRICGHVESLLDNIRNARDGEKYFKLRDISYTVGGYLHIIGWTVEEAVETLVGALPSADDWEAARRTARKAVEAGLAKPLDLEERPNPRAKKSPQEETIIAPDPPEQPTLDHDQTSTDEVIKEFNQHYMVVNDGGRAVIFRETVDPVLKRPYFERIKFEDFRGLYLNHRVKTGQDENGKPKYAQSADVWLRSRKRRQYIGGVVFDPSGRAVRSDTLNLWRGFGVKPKPGSWEKLKDHLKNVICSGETNLYEYALNWSARLIQHLDEQGEVAIVMRGIEGCGKGIFARAIKRLLGQHGLAISNPKHLTGNFNIHLRDCVFLFADECFFAGDKAHVGVLKAIVTEPTITIEGKYQNAVEAPNFLHIMMASNEEWVVPASLDSRRWLVLDVLRGRAGDLPYFDAIYEELDHGGYEALLHELLHRDISGFNPRKVPNTEGLEEQRKLSLPIPLAWWHDVLYRGYVFTSKLGLESYFSQWHEEVSTEVLFASYVIFSKERRDRHPMSRETFGRFMNNTVDARQRRLKKDFPVGEHIEDVQTQYGTTRQARVVNQYRPHGYQLGPLGSCRTAFELATGLNFDWPDETDDGS
jgi:hypothetical protein